MTVHVNERVGSAYIDVEYVELGEDTSAVAAVVWLSRPDALNAISWQLVLVDAVLAVHLKGAFNVTLPAWRRMREQGYGRIVNTTSSSGLLGNFGQANYGAAKMGLVGLTRVLAIEGFKYDIKVNALAPMARTRMTERLLGDLVEHLDPGLIAPVAAWLAHEDCPVTGEVYTAAAGRVARFFVGMTRGYYDPELSLESVRDHFDEARDRNGYIEPAGVGDEMQLLRDLLAGERVTGRVS
jgi:NAD(P)-dependent dehydrogenase (short-subunit alcohol dehydrogenase family)